MYARTFTGTTSRDVTDEHFCFAVGTRVVHNLRTSDDPSKRRVFGAQTDERKTNSAIAKNEICESSTEIWEEERKEVHDVT